MTDNISYKVLRSALKCLPKDERKRARALLCKLEILKIAPDDSLTGTKVRGFYLGDKKYDANSYIDVLRQILRLVFMKDNQASDKILSITGKKNKYFSRKPEDLRMPERIKGTDIYFETNENAKTICARCEKILKFFNMDFTSFEIEYYR